MPEPHPAVVPLAALLGEWAGEGDGQLPDGRSFAWRERLRVEHGGGPALAFHQRTTRPEGGPFHAEDGWLRLPPELQADAPDGRFLVELAVTSPTGILEALSGVATPTGTGVEVDAANTALATTEAAGEVLATRRRWVLDGDTLVVDFWMATPAFPERFHPLTSRLTRQEHA